MRISILTNGPGELWGWARPVAMELRKRNHSVSLWLLPCQFASGHEREAASLLGVDKLEGPAGVTRIWHDMKDERTDYVIQLGGDIHFGIHLSKMADVPLACYTYGAKKIPSNAKVFTAYKQQTKFIPNSEAIGDLVKDALELDKTPEQIEAWDWPKVQGAPRLLFFPGSRPLIRRAALEWLTHVKNILLKKMPSIRIRTLFSQFMPVNEFEEWTKAGLNPVSSGAGAAMVEADYALTQPGTNNFELMHCGLPGLVIAPAKFINTIPVSGLAGILGNMPLLGSKLKKFALMRKIKRWGGVIALPNRIAGHKILTEMYGDITPEDAAEEIYEKLRHPEQLEKIREELLSLSGESGAAAKLCDVISAK